LFLKSDRDAFQNTLYSYANFAASAMIGWYLLIPPAPPPSGINSFGGVSSAHADNGSARRNGFGSVANLNRGRTVTLSVTA
jgi:hypothetical protein